MHPAVRAKRNTALNDRVTFLQDVSIYIQFFLKAYITGFVICFLGVFVFLLPITFMLFLAPFSFWFIVKMGLYSMAIGLLCGLPIWLMIRMPLRMIGVPELGSALLACIPTLLVGLHLGLVLSDATSLNLTHLWKHASQDIWNSSWWLYLCAVVIAPFFAMRALYE